MSYDMAARIGSERTSPELHAGEDNIGTFYRLNCYHNITTPVSLAIHRRSPRPLDVGNSFDFPHTLSQLRYPNPV